MFPGAFDNKEPFSGVEETNKKYGGWDTQVKHVVFSNGRRDPWIAATQAAPGRDQKAADGQVLALSNGYHVPDLYSEDGDADPSVAETQKLALDTIKTWLEAWQPRSTGYKKRLFGGASRQAKAGSPWFGN